MAVELWIEKFRPRTLDEYVWRDPQMRQKVEEWLSQGGLPHVLFSGVSGTGKTSLALLLMRLLDIPPEDLLKINASRERKVDDLQDKIVAFVNAWAFNPSGLKYILLDEADKLSQLAQGMLRNELETYASVCRFIFTCNYPNKISPAIHGRVQEIKFSSLDDGEFLNRAAEVLYGENVEFEPTTLVGYVERTYPDLRKCLGLLQQNTINNILQPLRDDDDGVQDYLIEAINLFKARRYLEARKLIVAQADPEEYDALYRFLYQHIDLFAGNEDQETMVLRVISKAIVHDTMVADREINIAACLAELCQIAKDL